MARWAQPPQGFIAHHTMIYSQTQTSANTQFQTLQKYILLGKHSIIKRLHEDFTPIYWALFALCGSLHEKSSDIYWRLLLDFDISIASRKYSISILCWLCTQHRPSLCSFGTIPGHVSRVHWSQYKVRVAWPVSPGRLAGRACVSAPLLSPIKQSGGQQQRSCSGHLLSPPH